MGGVQPRGDSLRASDPLVAMVGFPFFHHLREQRLWRGKDFGNFLNDF
jgi:hypothetical protein